MCLGVQELGLCGVLDYRGDCVLAVFSCPCRHCLLPFARDGGDLVYSASLHRVVEKLFEGVEVDGVVFFSALAVGGIRVRVSASSFFGSFSGMSVGVSPCAVVPDDKGALAPKF